MNKMNSKSTLDHYLRETGIERRHRLKVIQYVKDSPANVAINQPAYSSDSSISPPGYAFDGNMKTRWESAHANNQYLEVDLEAHHQISKVVIAWEVAAAKRYDIQVSNDHESWTTVWSRIDGIEGMGTVESLLSNVTGQYVRMQGHERATRWGFSIWEMEVFGTPIQSLENPDIMPREGLQPSEKVTLVADGDIRLSNQAECSNILTPYHTHTPEFANCKSYATLRHFQLKHLKSNHRDLSNDINSYRSKLIHDNLQLFMSLNRTNSNSHGSIDARVHKINHHNWKIIGLTQRIKRRKWLNLDESIEHCNTNFHARRIICVEVNVENLPSTDTYASLQPGYEQLLLHQSLDGLIGIHGAQLTQGVLIPTHAFVVELLPWAPEDYFGTGRDVWGGWVQTRNRPTPLGIIYHNTDLNHLGYPLNRDSVPLCQNVSNTVMHNFSDDSSNDADYHNEVETELEYCFYDRTNEDFFRWDARDFIVEIGMIDKFVNVFLPSNATTDHVQSCDEMRQRGEGNNFVLYNVWCRNNSIDVSLQHYYQN